MTRDYFEHWSGVAKKIQEPIQELSELQVKAIQNLKYMKPEEIAKVKKPEELVEKQIQLAIENGHNALDYMQKSFNIIEKTMLALVEDFKMQYQPITK